MEESQETIFFKYITSMINDVFPDIFFGIVFLNGNEPKNIKLTGNLGEDSFFEVIDTIRAGRKVNEIKEPDMPNYQEENVFEFEVVK